MISSLLVALVTAGPSIYVRVDGSGYLRFAHSGHAFYSPKGTLTVRNGLLATPDGDVLLPQIHVPTDATRILVSLDGQVLAGPSHKETPVGQIVLALFPDGVGQDKMFATSVHATLSAPGDGVAGVIRGASNSEAAARSGIAKPSIDFGDSLRVEVAAKSTTQKDEILLGDIAQIDGPKDKVAALQNISLGPAPIYGVSRTFSQLYIVAKVRSAGFKPSEFQVDVPFGACVVRDAQHIPGNKILQSALDAVAAQFEVTNPLRSVSLVQDLDVQKGDLELQATIGRMDDSQISVNVDVRVDGTTVTSRTITLVADAQTVQIKIGDLVTIRLISGGATVVLPGKARTSGWLGQTITVQSDTGSVHTAKIVGSGVVEVKF